MFCPKCGTENFDNAANCSACGQPLQNNVPVNQMNSFNNSYSNQPAPKISNFLVPSILVTLFCCLPLGIPAIVFASQVDGKLRNGDVNGAIESSKKAKLFTWLSFGLGLGFGLIYMVIMIFAAIASSSSYVY